MPSNIIKTILISSSLLFAAAFSNGAHAERYYGGSHYGGYSSYGGHHYDRGYRHNRHHRHHRRHRSSDKAAYLVGGLVLGSIITHAYKRAHDPYVERSISYREPRVTRSSYKVSRRLFRDRDGNCFERTNNDRGDELLIELDRAECAW